MYAQVPLLQHTSQQIPNEKCVFNVDLTQQNVTFKKNLSKLYKQNT